MSYHIWKYLLLGVLVLALAGCVTGPRPPKKSKAEIRTMEITGYDAGKKSCNWKRNWRFKPVIASGPDKGRPKKVGMTASGVKAKPKRTIAADTKYYPFGTVMYIPGWGYGRVEDRGSAIKGPDKLDLFFGNRHKALQWGRRRMKVKIWQPR